jgi:DNA-directed RNA polymerase specialized sigma24 family protein
MATKSSPAPYRLNSVDQHGRQIDPAVLVAAEEIFPRALDYSLNVLGDSAVVANMLEEVAATVSRLIKTKDPPGDHEPIHDIRAYLFRAFLRHVNHLKRRQLTAVSVSEARKLSEPRWADPSREFENKILLDKFLGQCDFVVRDMAWRRMQGFSWQEVGKFHGLSAHAAEARFSYALRQVCQRLKI